MICTCEEYDWWYVQCIINEFHDITNSVPGIRNTIRDIMKWIVAIVKTNFWYVHITNKNVSRLRIAYVLIRDKYIKT